MIQRLIQYAKTTGVQFVETPCEEQWSHIFSVSQRGFAPHLRRVHMYKGKTLSESTLWVYHDLLHILFYDFAALNLGKDLFEESDRFLETHLSSEAFAVLAFDYHFLSFKKGATLAVDFSLADYPKFLKENRDLPHPQSFEFAKALVALYLSGDSKNLTHSKIKNQTYLKWIGHEIRYGEKQRRYASLWLNDLLQTKAKNNTVKITGSEAHYGVWDLIQTLHYGNDASWKNLLLEIKKKTKSVNNYFESFKKYNSSRLIPKNIDFRVTSMNAVSKKDLSEALKAPMSASQLYLNWQILSQFPPEDFSTSDLKLIEMVSKSSHKKIDVKGYKQMLSFSQGSLDGMTVNSDQLARSCFYLP